MSATKFTGPPSFGARRHGHVSAIGGYAGQIATRTGDVPTGIVSETASVAVSITDTRVVGGIGHVDVLAVRRDRQPTGAFPTVIVSDTTPFAVSITDTVLSASTSCPRNCNHLCRCWPRRHAGRQEQLRSPTAWARRDRSGTVPLAVVSTDTVPSFWLLT